jgi:hypothetical protein
MNKFKKPQFQAHYTPEDAFNEIFEAKDLCPYSKEPINPWTSSAKDILFGLDVVLRFNIESGTYSYLPPQKLPNLIEWADPDEQYKPHQILYQLKFGGDYDKARAFILNNYLNAESNYIRVGVKYFKEIRKLNRFGIELKDIVLWNKESIVDDLGRGELKRVKKYDDFTVVPNNLIYQASIDNQYNLYKPFPHTAWAEPVNITEIPYISGLMYHIFGEQQEIGYQYLKILYEQPEQILPVLCLVSKGRETGKTTFLNFIQMAFGANADVIPSDALISQFNSSYAYLNIIGIDETVIEKASAVEKIKMLATAKTLMINMKNVQEFSIPFFGKIILATNKENDFMRIDSEEIRFWVRKVNRIDTKDPNLEAKLLAEIPKFLRYLADIPAVEKKTRMVFDADDLKNDSLEAVFEESKSGLRKELEILIAEFFNNNEDMNSFHASAIDIKHRWFEKDSRISAHYIRKVMQDEMGLKPSEKVIKYRPFNNLTDLGEIAKKSGMPYYLTRENNLTETAVSVSTNIFGELDSEIDPF